MEAKWKQKLKQNGSKMEAIESKMEAKWKPNESKMEAKWKQKLEQN